MTSSPHPEPAPAPAPADGRWVILRHELPDGSHHFDLLLQPPGSIPDAPLRSWRCPHAPQPAGEGREQIVEAMPDHRAAYLTHEGPVTAGRGAVRRVAAGVIRAWDEAEGCVDAVLSPQSGDVWRISLRRGDQGWRLVCSPGGIGGKTVGGGGSGW